MYSFIVNVLRTLNELLTAGVAITALSLLLYALSFNLRDRVARSLALILLCVMIVFVCDALAGVVPNAQSIEFWLRLQWVGIIFLPAAYVHLSDALLATTGRPSRGRRRKVVRFLYVVSAIFLIFLPLSILVGPLKQEAQPAPHLQRTPLTWVFTTYYILAMLLAGVNLWRAYRRTVTRASRRRMSYLLAGSLAPALGSFPYLLFGSDVVAESPLFFWILVTISNVMVSVLLILMAYAVAFFGVSWPDRVVKRRLFKWLMRGPVTASTVLAIIIISQQASRLFGLDITTIIPAIMVGSILILEHLITLTAPVWEHWLLFGNDRSDMELLQALDERILTRSDLQQFLEAILAAACDRLQVSKAFVASVGLRGMEIFVEIGGDNLAEQEELPGNLLQASIQDPLRQDTDGEMLIWYDYWLIPLVDHENQSNTLLGLFGIARNENQILDEEQREALFTLAERTTSALRERVKQEQALSSLEALTPRMDMLQRLRAATRYDGTEILTTADLSTDDLSPWVKDALTHYWGGPKLTESPLLNLRIVRRLVEDHEENPTNALRAILRKAIEGVRPEGERRFTGEWILYNILEMKFMEGRKVREIALRLAMSEADLYRKQRVAIEAVANAIAEMEKQARNDSASGKPSSNNGALSRPGEGEPDILYSLYSKQRSDHIPGR